MNFSLFLILYISIFSFQSIAQLNEENVNSDLLPIATYDRETMWKNWALSACISEIYKGNQQVEKDTRYALYAYFELGEGLEIYSQINELLKSYLKNDPYLGHTNESGELLLIGGNDEIKIMKCIDFYISEELNSFINHHVELSDQVDLMNEAIRINDMDKLRNLFRNKDLNDKQFIPMTVDLLAISIDLKNFEAIKTLIELGVNPDAENSSTESALQYAIKFNINDDRYLKAMLYGGLSPNYKDSNDISLLHRAVLSAPESTKIIVERNSNHNTKKKKNNIKEKSNFLGYVKLLVELGAEVNAKDNNGKTALDYAIEEHKTDIAFYLIDNKAKFSDYTAELIYEALYRL